MNLAHSTGLCSKRRPSSVIALIVAFIASCALLAPSAAVFAQQVSPPRETGAQSLPAWEQLTPAQRETLIETVRERWNQNPQQRARMMNHAQRWKQMTPEQRQRAKAGKRRWDKMTPQQRAQARAAFEQGKTLSPEDRAALREKLNTMSPEQRREWLKQHRGARQGSQRHGMQGRGQQQPNPPPAQESRP